MVGLFSGSVFFAITQTLRPLLSSGFVSALLCRDKEKNISKSVYVCGVLFWAQILTWI